MCRARELSSANHMLAGLSAVMYLPVRCGMTGDREVGGVAVGDRLQQDTEAALEAARIIRGSAERIGIYPSTKSDTHVGKINGLMEALADEAHSKKSQEHQDVMRNLTESWSRLARLTDEVSAALGAGADLISEAAGGGTTSPNPPGPASTTGTGPSSGRFDVLGQ